MQVTIQYGTGNEVTKDFAGGTIDDALTDQATQALLGYGDNVEGHVGGVPQPPSTPLFGGMRIDVHDKACEKCELSRFFGIVIYMYYEKGERHHLPHFHAWYQDEEAVFGLAPYLWIKGSLPKRQERFVKEWRKPIPGLR